jgi:hypothetical protein
VTSRNKTASAVVTTASVSSQLTIRCHAGRVKRKKPIGLLKIGSAALPISRTAYQNNASVGHSSIIVVPVMTAIRSAAQKATTRKTGSTERFTGCPAMMIS